MFLGVDDRVLKCSLDMAVELLGYNRGNATVLGAIQDPAMAIVINQLFAALSGQKCWDKIPATVETAKTVWQQMARFYRALSENPAGATINLLVLALGVFTVFILVTKLRSKLGPIVLQEPHVAHFVAAAQAMLAELRPNTDVPFLPDVPSTPVPSPTPDLGNVEAPIEPLRRTPSPGPDLVANGTPKGQSARSSKAGEPDKQPNAGHHMYPTLDSRPTPPSMRSYRLPERDVPSTDEEVSPKDS